MKHFFFIIFFISIFLLSCSQEENNDNDPTSTPTAEPTPTPTSIPSSTINGDAQWAKTAVSGNCNTLFNDIEVDISGNIYAVGYLQDNDEVGFEDDVFTQGAFSGYEENALLVKYSSEGITQWARSVTAAENTSELSGVTTDTSGNIYAVGEIGGSALFDFGNGVTAQGTYTTFNILLVKYNSEGTAQFARTVEVGPSLSAFNCVKVDEDGNIYAAGAINGTGIFNFGNSVTAQGSYDSGNNILLVKYNSSGIAQWAKTVVTGLYQSEFNSMEIDKDGNILAAGFIYRDDEYDFGNGVTATGDYTIGSNILIVKYDSDGNALKAITVVVGPNSSEILDVTTDSSGNIFAAGYISGTGTYDFGNSVTAAGKYTFDNVFLIKYNIDIDAQWAKSVSEAASSSKLYSLVIEGQGNIYAAGWIYGTDTKNFGNGVTATGLNANTDILLVAYNSSGVAQWAKTITAGGIAWFTSVAISEGNIYAVGSTNGGSTFDFGNGATATGTSSNNIILVNYQ